MIELNNLSLRRDGRILFADANLQIHPSWHIGLTGDNGTGKSSFFAALLGQLGADTGLLALPSSWQIAHMAQEIAASEQTALDFVLAGDAQWYEVNAKLTEQQDSLSSAELTNLHQIFDDINGYATPTKAAQIMAGLGFNTAQHQQAVNGFSGGWRMRLNLARTLMCRADLLLLDEPTNHLDLDAILWLEDWLTVFQGTLVMISHDQQFLDKCVSHIVHIENQQMTLYTGNYSTFLRTRSERMAQQQQAYAKQQATKAHLQSYIDRFRAKATKAKQAQSRIKQLERMQELSPVLAASPFSFSFYQPSQMSSPLLVLDQAGLGYHQNVLIDKINLQITPDTRIGLLGMNGAGKSTVIKGLVGELPLLIGTRKQSDSLVLGYFNQHQMDALDAEATPLTLLRRLAGTTSDADLRAFLGSFNFKGERIDTATKLFSGGERARLTLALIVWQKPNVLVLDEPTNHLDLAMRQALTLALQDFVGAVIVVSHDRELIANVCDDLFLVHDGRCEPFNGDISDYSQWLKQAKKQQQVRKHQKSTHLTATNKPATANNTATDNALANATPVNREKELSKEEKRKQAAKQRELTAPLRKQISQLEKQLDTQHQKLADIETQLADSSLYDDGNKDKLLNLMEQQASLQNQHTEIEEALLMAMAALEDIQG